MDSLKQLLWLAAAGLSGAFIGLTMHPGERTRFQRLAFLCSGLLVAFWLTPVICRYFGLLEAEEIAAVAFAAGAFWSSIVDKMGQIIEAFRVPAVKGRKEK
ncbi:hypothetical protein SB5439_05002 [Klebsiella variicola]|uniref:hypothetical protein n=1 Tax=Klebsiella variicola TaxID=244366 RepID=UPI00109D5245|nr:hypothetical protein [Klebsiella variicola]VGQ11842.1 hypothetical protein SB5439_05002 [Klebsiella variicola]